MLEIRAFFAGRRLDLSFTIAAAAIAGVTYALIAWFNATAPTERAQAAAPVHAALFLIVFTGALVAPEWRYIAAAAGALTLPRFSALLLDLPTTRTLWPLFLGLAAALAVRSALGSRTQSGAAALSGRPAADRALAAALLALAACAIVTATDLFSPWIFTGYPFAPYELAPNIHAPLAMHAALTPLVNLGAPALFVLADGAYRARLSAGAAPSIEDSVGSQATARIARDLAGGAALALLLALPVYALQIAGVARAFAGVLDASVVAARAPGLFSDSGAAAALTATQLALTWLYLDLAPWIASRRRLRRILATALALLALAFTLWQGRLFLPALVWCLALIAVVRGGGPRRVYADLRAAPGRLLWLAAGAVALALFAVALVKLQLTPTLVRLDATLDAFFAGLMRGLPGAALAAVDPVRAALNIQALQLWSDRPWTGIGLNQFPVELAYRSAQPGAPELAIDNPPNLGLGALLDAGIPGAVILLCLALVWFARVRREPPTDATPETARTVRALQWAPLWLLPASLVGYQILHPEFAALCLFFWMLAPAPPAGDRREAAAAPAVLFFAGIYAGAALVSLLPAPRPPFWKAERRGGTPQLAPDLVAPAGPGPALLFFHREREFALADAAAHGAGPGGFSIILPADFVARGAQLYAACPGRSGGASDGLRPLELHAAPDEESEGSAGSSEFLQSYQLARYHARLPEAAACGATLRLRVVGELPDARRVFGLSADAFKNGQLSLLQRINPD